MGHGRELLERLCSPGGASDPVGVLVVAAHPDDEVLGAGGRLHALAPSLHVSYVSDGAPRNPRFARDAGFPDRESYARARRAEARAALALSGIEPARIFELRAIDQEAALELPRLTRELVRMMRELRPEIVLSHPYEGGHPDHDASALSVHAARHLLRSAGEAVPTLVEFTSYHEHAGQLRFGEFLREPGIEERAIALEGEVLERKLAMLRCHQTQQPVWRAFPIGAERFRIAPEYDFRRPPPARFFYDHVDWGMSGQCFLAFAAAALAELAIEGPC